MYANKPVHLMIDGLVPDVGYIRYTQRLKYFITKVITKLEMVPIGKLLIHRGEVEISLIQMIAKSHIAIHWHKPSYRLYCDLFSCEDYNTNEVAMYTIEELELEDASWRSVYRAVPDHI